MKEMMYQKKRTKEVLHSGVYRDHKFVILSLGTHPTAYVECKIYDCDSDGDKRLENISVHGGFTYLDFASWEDDIKTIYLGWDYGHYMDYEGYEELFPLYMRSNEKKRWTTAEIFEEVKSVIDQLIEVETK